MGGASAAYFLNHHLKDRDYTIDLYEKTSRIGGRAYAKEFLGKKYEVGASILISDNQYGALFAKKFGTLKPVSDNE